MSCQCASDAIDCMPRPGVADLCCPKAGGCCKPVLQFSDIPAGTLAQFDLDGTVPDDAAEGTLDLLQQYAKGIAAAFEQLVARSCMAEYVGGCQYLTKVCVPASCSCCCSSCDLCYRETVPLVKASHCVGRSRVEAVTVNGVPASLNGDDAGAVFDVSWCNGAWRLHGVDPDCGGVVEVAFILKPLPELFCNAVLDLACQRVPCLHSSSCNREDDRNWRLALLDRGLTGSDFGDAMVTECKGADRVRLGRASREEFGRWAVSV